MNFSSLSAPLLKEERKRLGLSQADVASQCGVSREIWGKYERGSAVPGGDVLKAFAVLGADVQYVLTGARCSSLAKRQLPANEQLMLEIYQGLSPHQQKQLLSEMLAGGKASSSIKASGSVVVTGSGNRAAGGNFHEKE